MNLQYNLTQDEASVVFKIYDNQGKMVARSVQEEQLAGFYQMRWNLSDLSNGLYLVCLEINGKCTKTEKVVLLK